MQATSIGDLSFLNRVVITPTFYACQIIDPCLLACFSLPHELASWRKSLASYLPSSPRARRRRHHVTYRSKFIMEKLINIFDMLMSNTEYWFAAFFSHLYRGKKMKHNYIVIYYTDIYYENKCIYYENLNLYLRLLHAKYRFRRDILRFNIEGTIWDNHSKWNHYSLTIQWPAHYAFGFSWLIYHTNMIFFPWLKKHSEVVIFNTDCKRRDNIKNTWYSQYISCT